MLNFRLTALTSAALFALALSATAQSTAPPTASTAEPSSAEPAPPRVGVCATTPPNWPLPPGCPPWTEEQKRGLQEHHDGGVKHSAAAPAAAPVGVGVPASATPAISPDEQELSPKGIDKQKFDAVYRAAKSVKEATGVGVNFPRYSELVQTFATEVSIARDKASSPGEQALAQRFASVLAAYRDSVTLWQHKIGDASTNFLGRQIMVAISRVGTGEMLEDPEMRRIVDTYKITTQTISTGAGGGKAITINPVSVQIPWIMADMRMATAEKTYLAATVNAPPSVQPVPSYIEELKQLAALRDQGVITKEEFEAKKKRLLGLDKPPKKAPLKASTQKTPPPP